MWPDPDPNLSKYLAPVFDAAVLAALQVTDARSPGERGVKRWIPFLGLNAIAAQGALALPRHLRFLLSGRALPRARVA